MTFTTFLFIWAGIVYFFLLLLSVASTAVILVTVFRAFAKSPLNK
jgi:hypothetical protein